MTEFWIIGGLLLVVALLFVVLPLWRSTVKNNDVVRDAANLEIFRDQIAEMDADLANGLLTPELYEQGKQELQARMLEEVKSPGDVVAQKRNPLKVLAAVIVVLVPLASVGLYLQLGNPNVFLPQDTQMSAEGFGTVLSETALKELQDKLAQNPKDPNSWLLLARSLAQMERFAEAAKAYDKLTQLVPNEAQLWADYADALAMANGQSLVGKPAILLDKALAIDPANPKALALSGTAAMERGDYPRAAHDWEALLKLMPDKNSEDAKMVMAGIQQAKAYEAQLKGGKPPMMAPAPAAPSKPMAPGAEAISGTVELASSLKGKASPDDTVFVLAKAANGPPMPLAVVRVQVKDLPLKFKLDDSMAMAPQMKLSNFGQVVVVARVSKSGNAMPQAGDLQGMSAPLKPGRKGLKISINQTVK